MIKLKLVGYRKETGDRIDESEYGITNAYVAEIVYGDKERQIYIPSNLNIIATMNTSDQNVFTLDTAFQRRWHMKMVENKVENAVHAKDKILDTTITWEQFNRAVNKLILDANARLSSSEDKRLGAYFVTRSDLRYDTKAETPVTPETTAAEKKAIKEAQKQNNRFPEKVLKYLWDDAFKFARNALFEDEKYPSLEDVIRTFRDGRGNDRFLKIFKDGVLGELQSNS